MNRIKNIFGKVNTFVRGTFNYVFGYDSDEDAHQDPSEVRETADALQHNQIAGHSKYNFQVKRKNKGGKKKKKSKKTNRNKTPSRIHPRQKQITVKIPEGPQPFNTGNLFKVPQKSHTQIDCSSAGLAKQSDELLISEKTMHLDNAIKYGNKAEAIDVGDEFTKQPQQQKQQAFLPLIAKHQNLPTGVLELSNRADTKKSLKGGNISKKQNKTSESDVLTKRVDVNKSLKKGNILPLNGEKDEIKNPSTPNKEYKAKTQDTKSVDEHESGRHQEPKLKLPDIHSCQGSLVSQPISCTDRNQPMASVLSKKPSDTRPSLLTIVQRGTFLTRLETIQENVHVDEKHFDSQSLPKARGKGTRNLAEAVQVIKDRKRLVQERLGVSKVDFRVGASNLCLAQTTQAVHIPRNVSYSDWEKKAVKDINSVEAVEGQDSTAQEEVLAVKKKSKRQKRKSKTNSKTNQGLNDKETVESCYQGTGSQLNPIVHNGKSPLERLREVESKLLEQKHSQLKKVFSRNNKVAPLTTDELGGLKKVEVKNDLRLVSSTSISEAVKPLLQPLKSEKSHPSRKELRIPSSSPATRVPAVLPTPSALPRIVPRCQSPKLLNKTANEPVLVVNHNYKCARPYLSQFTYEPSDDEQEQAFGSRKTAATKIKEMKSSSLKSSFAYEPSDEEEQRDSLAPAATKPKRKFSVQDRLRMGRKVMSSDKGNKESKHQTTKTDIFSKPTERVAVAAGLKASALGLSRRTETRSTDKVVLPSTSRYSTHHQQKQHLLPSLDSQGRNSIAKKDDLKILDLFEFED